jgi:hypothetical protein
MWWPCFSEHSNATSMRLILVPNEEMKCRRRDAASFLLSVSEWLRGDLNLQAKSLMMSGSIPTPKTIPAISLRLLGFLSTWLRG